MLFRVKLKNGLSVAVLVVFTLLCLERVVAQSKPFVGRNCESALALIDNAAVDALKEPNASIIVIARLGTHERSRRLNELRLKAVLKRFADKARNNIVGAIGSRTNGMGRVELYVNGELLYAIDYPKNGHIDCRRCCG